MERGTSVTIVLQRSHKSPRVTDAGDARCAPAADGLEEAVVLTSVEPRKTRRGDSRTLWYTLAPGADGRRAGFPLSPRSALCNIGPTLGR